MDKRTVSAANDERQSPVCDSRALGSRARYPYRAKRVGRLIVTTCIQGTCHRIVDRAFTNDREGNRYESVAIILRPWRRNEWGEYLPQRALVVGWRR